MSDNIIKITGVKKYFGGVKALDGVDLTIKKGEVHCLAGENGCGKSTIINVISGFYTPDAGTIEIDGKEYSKLTTQMAIDAGVQVIYQDLSVFPNLTVRENLALNMEVAGGKKFVSKKRFQEIATLPEELLRDIPDEGSMGNIAVYMDLRRQFFRLSDEERLIISMHIFAGYSSTEIAEILHMNANTVRSKESRALKKLSDQLEAPVRQ